MNHTILITGANSFIAKHLIPILEKNYTIHLLTRTPKAPNEFGWDISNSWIDERAFEGVKSIIHLAGSKLNDGTPLTAERQQLVYESRIGATLLIKDYLTKLNIHLDSFVSASAIGYYAFNDKNLEIDESGNKGFGFAATLSDDWEKAADTLKDAGLAKNVSKLRVSLVLGNESGIFPMYKQILAQRPNVVNQLDTASVPWNHVEDMAGMFAFAVTHQLDGVYNTVAPQPASQRDIYKAMDNATRNAQHQILPFKGQHLVSKKIVDAGYQFKFPEIQSAINNLYNK